MTSATRGIGKSVHSPDQAAFCELMIGARKAAGLTQHARPVPACGVPDHKMLGRRRTTP
jgi:hypothetical protein